MNELISVVLPTYNRALDLKKAIDSVLIQTYPYFELIVVDDGSSDETMQMMEAVKDERILFIRQQVNKGAAASRNTGIRASKGTYIAFLDSDDTWHPDKLEKQYQLLSKSEPSVGGCVTYYDLMYPNKSKKNKFRFLDRHASLAMTWFFRRHCEERKRRGNPVILKHDTYRIINRQIPIQKDFYKQSLLGCNLSPGSTLMFKKECLEKIGLQNESLKRFEDWEWQIRFSQHYSWISLPISLANIRAGHVADFEVCRNALKALLNVVQVKDEKDKGLVKMAISYELFYAALKNKMILGAVFYFLKAFKSSPFIFCRNLISVIKHKIIELFR